LQTPQFLFSAINTDVIRNRGYYAYPPTGLQWLATSLADRDYDITLHDLNLKVLQRIIDEPEFNYHNWLDLLDEVLEKLIHPLLPYHVLRFIQTFLTPRTL